MYNICDILYKEQSFFVFNIRNNPYILYVYVPLVKIFRVAWPCEDFRENAACAAFALQESFLNDLPCSTFCASRPLKNIIIFSKSNSNTPWTEWERGRERENSRASTKTVRNFVSLCLPSSLSLSSSSFSIIITYYYRAVLLLMFGLLNSRTPPPVRLFLCFAFIFKIFVFFFYVYLFFTVREKSEKYCSWRHRQRAALGAKCESERVCVWEREKAILKCHFPFATLLDQRNCLINSRPWRI